MSRAARTAAGALVVVSVSIGAASGAQAASQPDRVRGGYIVTLRDVPAAKVSSVAGTLARGQGATVRRSYRNALRGFSVRGLSATGVSRLLADRRVVAVQPDYLVQAAGTQTSPPSYGLDRIDQRNLPLNGSYTYPRTGLGVDAYVIDSGIRTTHQDFGGRARSGFDAIDGGPADDCNGHGTHVAGTLGGASFGVAKQASLIAVRVLDCGGSGDTTGILAGIDWAIANHVAGKPAVANISIGTNIGTNDAFDNGVRALVSDGISVSVAAGNGLQNGLYPLNACNTSPGRTLEAITVSNTNSSDTKSFEANFGSCVDLFAPGTSIVSASSANDTGSASLSGTSMASPHVAGAAAQYLEANPASTPAQVQSAIVAGATTGVVKSPGSGSPNRLLFVGFITGGGGGGGNTPPVASFTSSCTGLTCSFADTSTDAGGSIASRSWTFGDGGTSTAASPSRTYAASGTYTVTLTVTDNGGATATTTRQVTVTAPGGDPDPSTPTLTSGVARTGTNAGAGGFVYYKVAIPAGAASVRLDLTGPACGLLSCNPDIDLYGRNGAKPTTTATTCKSATGSNTETCTISAPPAGYVYVGVHTYSGTAGKTFTVKATVG